MNNSILKVIISLIVTVGLGTITWFLSKSVELTAAVVIVAAIILIFFTEYEYEGIDN